MYLIYKDRPGYMGFCTESSSYTTQLTLSSVLKELSLNKQPKEVTGLQQVIKYALLYKLRLAYVYDENLKEIPVTTFINDNPELFI